MSIMSHISFANNLPKWHEAKVIPLIKNLYVAQRTSFRQCEGENFRFAMLNA
jgi:hypothetical protein